MEIKFKNVSYIVTDKKVLDGIDLKIKKGEINAIIGPSGSGKSTIGQLLDATIFPTSGEVIIGDKKISKDIEDIDIKKLRFNVGVVSDFPEEKFFSLTVEKEIMDILKYFDYPKDKMKKRISDSLRMVKLPESYLKRDPLSLSSGEMKRLSLAATLAINPEILVLDEPTIGLDSEGKKELIKILKIIKRRYNKTIVIITQDIEFIHKFVDYVILVNSGKIIYEGDKYKVFKQDKILLKNGIVIPKIIQFELLTLDSKKIKLGYRDEINDLIKDILRNK